MAPNAAAAALTAAKPADAAAALGVKADTVAATVLAAMGHETASAVLAGMLCVVSPFFGPSGGKSDVLNPFLMVPRVSFDQKMKFLKFDAD